jgi:hypothetical protein
VLSLLKGAVIFFHNCHRDGIFHFFRLFLSGPNWHGEPVRREIQFARDQPAPLLTLFLAEMAWYQFAQLKAGTP